MNQVRPTNEDDDQKPLLTNTEEKRPTDEDGQETEQRTYTEVQQHLSNNILVRRYTGKESRWRCENVGQQ